MFNFKNVYFYQFYNFSNIYIAIVIINKIIKIHITLIYNVLMQGSPSSVLEGRCPCRVYLQP